MQRHWIFLVLSMGLFVTLAGSLLVSSAPSSKAQSDAFIIVPHHYLTGSTTLPVRQDPVLAESPAEVEYLTNVFLPLVRIDPEDPTTLLPALASSWLASPDGLEYTFNLNTNIVWVSYDPASGVILTHRPIHANDVVYSMYRVCDSRENSTYAVEVIAPVIKGCEQSLSGRNPADVLGVYFQSTSSVKFVLNEPNAAFPYLAALFTLMPLPTESVDSNDVAWGPGTVFWSNGPFVPTEYGWLRNAALPDAISGFSNIDLVTFSDAPTPPDNTETILRPSTGMAWINLDTNRAPLNNVNVRRALSAGIDRAALGEGFAPMHHMAPITVGGGIPDDAVGVGYDVAYAREQLRLAGYPNCEGMPPIVHIDIPPTIISGWQALGCSDDQFVEWTAGSASAPQMVYTLTPYATYTDVDFYINLLGCDTSASEPRCGGVNILNDRARLQQSEIRRYVEYPAMMNVLFGANGYVPAIPLARPIVSVTIAAWLDGPSATNGAATAPRYDYFFVAPETAPSSVYGDGTLIYTGTATGRTTARLATPTFRRDPTPVLPPFDRTVDTDCYLQSLFSYLNVRSSPYGGSPIIRVLGFGDIVRGIAYYTIPNSFRYQWQIEGGGWVRDNLVAETQGCFELLPFNR